MDLRMCDMQPGDRPRERLERHGANALSDAELVAIQLGSGHKDASALTVARLLIAEWGGIAGLAGARPEELARTAGIGPAKATRLAAAFGLATRMGRSTERPSLRSSADIAREAGALIGRSRTEQVVVLAVDGANRLIRAEVVASGTAKACPVPVREIVATVLRFDGVAFAVAHNHPGGDPTPSVTDFAATQALRGAAEAVGLRFLDHLVVAGTRWRSILAPEADTA